MERVIKLEIPSEIIESFNKDRHLIEKIEFCGNYAADKLEKELKAGYISSINEDIKYILSVCEKSDEINKSEFISSYYTFIENTLINFMNSKKINIETHEQKEDMLITLQKVQEILLSNPEIDSIKKLNELVIERFKKTNPHRLQYMYITINKMSIAFIKLGLGKISIPTQTDVNKVKVKNRTGE